jgi:predicted transcriptional regulator
LISVQAKDIGTFASYRISSVPFEEGGDQMSDDSAVPSNSHIGLTADIVSAFVSKNPVPAASLPDLVQAVHASLRTLGQPASPPVEERAPAVSIKKSVTPDYLICLDDGKKFKSLKRHLAVLGMTPDQYRAKWGLPHDYPMVARSYSGARSAMAKEMGWGRKRAPEHGAGTSPQKGKAE